MPTIKCKYGECGREHVLVLLYDGGPEVRLTGRAVSAYPSEAGLQELSAKLDANDLIAVIGWARESLVRMSNAREA